MTIYILDNDSKKASEYLDDTSLGHMIKTISQVLCNTHWLLMKKQFISVPPLIYSDKKDEWSQWTMECVVNYKYLVKLGMFCCIELMLHRGILKLKKYQLAIDWSSDNLPDLPIHKNDGSSLEYGEDELRAMMNNATPFPLVMPEKYLSRTIYDANNPCHIITDQIQSYRNYYQAKLEKRIKSGLTRCESNSAQWTSYDESKLPIWSNRLKPDWLNI